MKHLLLLCLIVFMPRLAAGQFFINPDTIYQAGDIILQNTDVYYDPFAPPGDSDTRENLCNQSNILRDSNGVESPYREYQPIIYDTTISVPHFVPFHDWNPCHDTVMKIGYGTQWQRLFTARDKPVSTYPNRKSDIIVGKHVTDSIAQGEVIVSKNEDVDFRASGTVRMEAGFHVMPGAFFHAYIEPKWDTTVFSDDFNGSSLDGSKWIVVNGHGDYGIGAHCSYDSTVKIDTDYEATDNYALDIPLIEDTCTCNEYGDDHLDTCVAKQSSTHATHKFLFSAAALRSCPWPLKERVAPLQSAYAHAPYGKYEYRDKIPHVLHHTNSWACGYWEADISETPSGIMGVQHPSIGHSIRYGPYTGVFRRSGSNVYFISSAPKWSYTNNPNVLFIDNLVYGVQLLDSAHTVDTLVPSWPQHIEQGGYPSYLLADSVNPITFYYDRSGDNKTEPVAWHVAHDSHGTKRYFSAPYRIDGVNTYHFTKAYQPTSIKLITKIDTVSFDTTIKTLRCHWEYTLNYPDSTKGILLLDDTMAPSDFDSAVGNIQYSVVEASVYPIAPVIMDRDTSWTDSADRKAYAKTPYRYHTYGMEVLPHELRILYDSNVIRRIPDRLVPRNNRAYDYATNYPRTRMTLYPAEFDIDLDPNDSLGTNSTYSAYYGAVPGTLTYKERKYFETYADSCSGCWPINGHRAAHHRLDYVKIWDVPSDMKIPDYKQ